MSNRILVMCGVILALSSGAAAFFLGWGSTEQQTPSTQYYYHKRLVENPVQTYRIESDRRQIPSVPIQVPLQAQFSPLSNVHNVQLVPCLCPVSQDYPYDNQHSHENVYVGPNGPLQQVVQQPSFVQQPAKKSENVLGQ